MLVSAGLIVLTLLVLALVRYDRPRFKETLGYIAAHPSPSHLMQRVRQFFGIMSVLMDMAAYCSGFLLVVGGLAVASLYLAGPVDKRLDDKLAGIGTGLTMYAAGFAVVVLLGRKQNDPSAAPPALETGSPYEVWQAVNALAADVDHNSSRLGILLKATIVTIALLVGILAVLIYAVFFNTRR